MTFFHDKGHVPKLPDLIELSSIDEYTTYTKGGSDQILGVVDNATYTGDDDNGATVKELNDTWADGGILEIDGVRYTIDVITPESFSTDNTLRITSPDGDVTLEGNEFRSEFAFIKATPVGGGDVRNFLVLEDCSFAGQISSITTGDLDYTPLGNDVKINASKDEDISIICFTPGTLIATPLGERPVETLVAGDRIFTRDNGIQELRWVGRRDLTAEELMADPKLRPVRIRAGSLPGNNPERDLVVSPAHRILLTGPRAALLFEESEVLAAANHLVGRAGIERIMAPGISYIHLMFDQHEVILSNGAWTESFQPSERNLRGLEEDQREELALLFPDLQHQSADRTFHAARKSLKRHETRLLAQ
ncbi:Hint domain-containing protein [Pelagovum pacificum]|nr:Hint domain-containing protein [Pelagovum pacificum]QQA44796.1 Hint domain-containing protein [Pelagovum pacificum]